jgi:hypothetical protein
MGNCCSCGATVPSPPQITPMPVLSQPSTTSPPSRTRIQPSSNPESTHQDPNSQDRMKSLPRLPPSSPQNPRTQSATMSYPPRTLTSTVTRMLTDQSEYVAQFWRIDRTFLAVRRFRILIVGKVSPCNAQPSQTGATINCRGAPGNPRSLMPLLGWTCRCVFGPICSPIYLTYLP